MSHFRVVVCTENPKRLDEIMAPWDENREVEPYRSYEDGVRSEVPFRRRLAAQAWCVRQAGAR